MQFKSAILHNEYKLIRFFNEYTTIDSLNIHSLGI